MDAKIREALEDIFTYHAPTEGDQTRYARIRGAALGFAEVVMTETPPGADRMAALRKIREAVMTANAAVALKGRGIDVRDDQVTQRGGPISGAFPLRRETLEAAAPGALAKANAGDPEKIYDPEENVAEPAETAEPEPSK